MLQSVPKHPSNNALQNQNKIVGVKNSTQITNQFLAGMSHELRTPLSAILGFSEALQENVYGKLDARQLHVLSAIESSGRHLFELLENILDLSKIEADKLELSFRTISLPSIYQSTLFAIKKAARKKGVNFASTPPTSTATIQADEHRLKQILVLLLTNAIQFAPENGEVGLDIITNHQKGNIQLIVWNTGELLDPNEFLWLFNPLSQINDSSQQQYAATTLRLVLAARLIEMHKGKITMTADVHKGNQFTVTLPQHQTNTIYDSNDPMHTHVNISSQMSSNPQENAHILLAIEEYETNSDGFVAYLQLKGYHVSVIKDDTIIIETILTQNPHLILIDMLNALEIVHRIRYNVHTRSLPIILLESTITPENEALFLDAGVNAYLSRLSLKHIVAKIDTYTGATFQS